MTYPVDPGPETPEADAAEQATSARPGDDDRESRPSDDIEAPDWDADGNRTVDLDDDYR